MKLPNAFESYAAEYDDHFSRSAIGRAQRRQVWRALQPFLGDRPLDILEVNCGTGIDALRLAGKGHRVRATDKAWAMIDIARERGRHAGASIHFQTAHFLELDRQMAPATFDLVFSNFGGLNCLAPRETQGVAAIFANMLKPGGRLFLVYMTRDCLWERLYFYFKKTPHLARRRRQRPLQVPLHGGAVPVWYYPRRELKALYASHFCLERTFPIGLGVPPSYLEHFFGRHPRLLRALDLADRWLAFPFLADLADHQALVFRKMDAP